MLQILSGCRLVQKDDFRPEHQNGCNGDPLFLAVAQGGNRPVPEGVQTTDFQSFLHPWTNFLFTDTPVSQSQRHLVENLRFGDHLVGILHHIADVVGPLFDAQGVQVNSFHGQAALLRLFKAADHLGEGGFSGTIGADNAEHFPLVDGCRDPPQGMMTALIGKVQILGLQQNLLRYRVLRLGLGREPTAHLLFLFLREHQFRQVGRAHLTGDGNTGIFQRRYIQGLPDSAAL